MLAVGRERARERGLDEAVTFVEGNAEELPYPGPQLRCVTIAFGIRNVPRIERALAEAHRVLQASAAASCAWNFPPSTCRASTRSTSSIPST